MTQSAESMRHRRTPQSQGVFWWEVRLQCYQELGWALFYMRFLYPGINWGNQRRRVLALAREAVAHDGTGPYRWWERMLCKIENETENMC